MSYASRIIAAAQSAHRLIPQTFTCTCCGKRLDREDHMRGWFGEEYEAAVAKELGENVCTSCAEDFTPETQGDMDAGAVAEWKWEMETGR